MLADLLKVSHDEAAVRKVFWCRGRGKRRGIYGC